MSCDWETSQEPMAAEVAGMSSEAFPSLERQGSRMQVDEDSKNARYQTDTFRMLGYKVVPCCKRFKHHWNSCPFLHPNERAKRRDPRLYCYESTMCPAVKNSDDKRKLACPQKDQCRFSHNVFEEYLHPDRYRTVMCKDYPRCSRDVCFFAHTQDEIRRVDQAWSWNQLARDNFRSTPLSAFLSATGGLKVSPVAAAITRLLYNGRLEEAKRSVADTVGKMFRECWKLDNPEAAVLIEALAFQAELPLALQPDVEEAVKLIRRSGPRRPLDFGREGTIGAGFLPESPVADLGTSDLPGQHGLQAELPHTNSTPSWAETMTSRLEDENLLSQLTLLASLSLNTNNVDPLQQAGHWSNVQQGMSSHFANRLQNVQPAFSLPESQPKLNSLGTNSQIQDEIQAQTELLDQRALQRLIAALGTFSQQGAAPPLGNSPPLTALQTILHNAGVTANGHNTQALGLPSQQNYGTAVNIDEASTLNSPGYLDGLGTKLW